MAKNQTTTPQDKNGHPLKVGDLVSFQQLVSGPFRVGGANQPHKYRTVKFTITSMYPSRYYGPRAKADTARGLYGEYDPCFGVHGRVSEKSTHEYYCIDRQDLTYVGEGAKITEAGIKAAEAARKKAREAKPFKPTVAHFICYVMYHHGGVMKQEEILRRTDALRGITAAFTPSNGACYFSTGSRGWQADASLVNGGFLKKEAPKTFSLTKEGEKLAKEYMAWRDG